MNEGINGAPHSHVQASLLCVLDNHNIIITCLAVW